MSGSSFWRLSGSPAEQNEGPEECPMCSKPLYDDDGDPIYDEAPQHFCSAECERAYSEKVRAEDRAYVGEMSEWGEL